MPAGAVTAFSGKLDTGFLGIENATNQDLEAVQRFVKRWTALTLT